MTSATEISPWKEEAAAPHGYRWSIGLLLAGLWLWACMGCADEWTDNPMYSYGWFVPPLVLFFAWRRLDEPFAGQEPLGAPRLPRRPLFIAVGAAFCALLSGPTELLRYELPDDRLNNWCLALLAVGCTLWVIRCLGGWRLAATMAFPIGFFLTAVAWPKRYETPVTIGLQKFVAGVIVEVLHVMGIHADPHGTTIYLDSGPVGIAEACSGVRSLQASLMISLAIGELFFLRWSRRWILVVICAGMAMVLNLGRTLSLCLITHYQGAHAMEKAHDWIGNIILLVLPMLAWVAGRALTGADGFVPTAPLPRKPAADGTPPPVPYLTRLREITRRFAWHRMPNLAPALVIAVAGVVSYHGRMAYLTRLDPPQQTPAFTAQLDEVRGISEEPVRKDIWEALNPTSGGNYSYRNIKPPISSARMFHFFWKPSAANRWATGHRPDICMPAGGWERDGEVQWVEVDFAGRRVPMAAFRFKGVGVRATQLWGMWRNGEPLKMDFFSGRDVLEWSFGTGRTHSAVEVISCIVIHRDEVLPFDAILHILPETFSYIPPESGGKAAAGAPPTTAAPAGSTPTPAGDATGSGRP